MIDGLGSMLVDGGTEVVSAAVQSDLVGQFLTVLRRAAQSCCLTIKFEFFKAFHSFFDIN